MQCWCICTSKDYYKLSLFLRNLFFLVIFFQTLFFLPSLNITIELLIVLVRVQIYFLYSITSDFWVVLTEFWDEVPMVGDVCTTAKAMHSRRILCLFTRLCFRWRRTVIIRKSYALDERPHDRSNLPNVKTADFRRGEQ